MRREIKRWPHFCAKVYYQASCHDWGWPASTLIHSLAFWQRERPFWADLVGQETLRWFPPFSASILQGFPLNFSASILHGFPPTFSASILQGFHQPFLATLPRVFQLSQLAFLLSCRRSGSLLVQSLWSVAVENCSDWLPICLSSKVIFIKYFLEQLYPKARPYCKSCRLFQDTDETV